MKAINTKRPSKLDLNAPLLSARRSNIATMSSIVMSRSNSLNGSCHRVPFLWEQSPGKPKDSQTRNNVLEDKALPLPMPPPFQSREEWPTLICHDEHGFNGSTDDDDDEKEDEDDDEGFSDGIDLFSLAKSLKTSSEREEEDDNESDIHDNNNNNNNESMSPSFMIERFLPAATALAASSLSALEGDKQLNKSKPVYVSCKEGSCVPRKAAGEAYSSSKGCGLEMLFPWRVKHRVCGVKNPVRQPRSRLKP